MPLRDVVTNIQNYTLYDSVNIGLGYSNHIVNTVLHATLSGYAVNSDTRLTDSRYPTAHNSSPHTVNYAVIETNTYVAPTSLGSAATNAKFLRGDNTWQTGVGGYTEGARVINSGAQSIPNATWTALNFDTEDYDTDTIHDNSTNNDRLTCKTAGKYLIVASYLFETNTVGVRTGRIMFGGYKNIGYIELFATSPGLFFNTIYNMAVNDYVTLEVHHTAGRALNVMSYATANDVFSPLFMMHRIG